MKKPHLSLPVILALAVSCVASRAVAQASSQPADRTPPSYDMKPQSLLDLDDLHKKFVSLAQAIPADKYTWRPAPGVRSVSEVFLHVAGQNLRFASDLGTTPAPDFKSDGYEKSTTDKTKIIDQLNQSFDYAHAAIEKMANIDFRKPATKYGPDANAGDLVYLIVTHTHEHLGQSIAYARVNGIVPPWTAAQAQKQGQ